MCHQVDSSRTHIGDLAAIVGALRGSSRQPQLATPSPASLLSQLTGVCAKEEEEEEEVVLVKNKKTSRRLVEEIPKGRRVETTGFAANLRKAFGPEKTEGENKEKVKIRNDEIFLTEVQTRRIK